MGILNEKYRFEAKDHDDKKSPGHGITGWTPGLFDENNGWLSETANNVYMVARKGDAFDASFKNGKNKGKMTVAIPMSSKYPYAKGKYIEHYVINMFDKGGTPSTTPKYSIIFHHVKVLAAAEKTLVAVGQSKTSTSKYKEIVLAVESGVDYPIQS